MSCFGDPDREVASGATRRDSTARRAKVLLLGGSGSMGFQTFLNLWSRRSDMDIVLLLLPLDDIRQQFAPYQAQAGSSPIAGSDRTWTGGGLHIIWEDARTEGIMEEAVKGVDHVISTMAVISPAADVDPQRAHAVNARAHERLVRAIEAEGADHIRLTAVSTVALTGSRLPPLHVARIGDPLLPALFDEYAMSKLKGERAVLESSVRHWAVLRQTFILVPDLFALEDPIMFHQPLDTCFEAITAEDAGKIANVVDIPKDSDFWRRVYNMSGGPGMRTNYYNFLVHLYGMVGLPVDTVMERRWFALQNFHCHYYEDAHTLNAYLSHFRTSLEQYLAGVRLPLGMWSVSLLASVPGTRQLVHWQAHEHLRKLAESPTGTLGWMNAGDDRRIRAFYGSAGARDAIPGWEGHGFGAVPDGAGYTRLDHGYDERKAVLSLSDLQGAAAFRGGACTSAHFTGDLYELMAWSCHAGHAFSARAYTVLKAGHWCVECMASHRHRDSLREAGPFYAQLRQRPDPAGDAAAAGGGDG